MVTLFIFRPKIDDLFLWLSKAQMFGMRPGWERQPAAEGYTTFYRQVHEDYSVQPEKAP